MNANFQLASHILWIAHPVLQFAVAMVMLWRGLHRKFPVFFTYLLVQIVDFAVVFPVYIEGDYQAFFYAYWIFAAINLILGFLVIHEIFVDVFRPYHTLKDLGTVLFKWAGLVMLLVAGVVAAGTSPSVHGPLTQAILTVERCVRVIQCGLVLFLIIFARYLGISWKQRSCGIALGFGSFAAVELLIVAISSSRTVNNAVSGLVLLITYTGSILVWLVYMGVKRRLPQSPTAQLASQRWDQSLNDIQHPATDDSLIPLFENMVDRALSRSHEDHHEEGFDMVERTEKILNSLSSTAANLISSSTAGKKKD
jgi:hypothetical protein